MTGTFTYVHHDEPNCRLLTLEISYEIELGEPAYYGNRWEDSCPGTGHEVSLKASKVLRVVQGRKSFVPVTEAASILAGFDVDAVRERLEERALEDAGLS